IPERAGVARPGVPQPGLPRRGRGDRDGRAASGRRRDRPGGGGLRRPDGQRLSRRRRPGGKADRRADPVRPARVPRTPALAVRLYNSQLSGNCYKVRLLLTLLGIPFERIEVDVIDRSNRKELLGDKNPALRVPTLELDNGQYLAESNAILW